MRFDIFGTELKLQVVDNICIHDEITKTIYMLNYLSPSKIIKLAKCLDCLFNCCDNIFYYCKS